MTSSFAPVLDRDVQMLIDAVVRDLVADQRAGGGGSRDLGPDATTTAAAAAPVVAPGMSTEEAERFFGGILQSIVTQVIPTVATSIHSLLQQRRRELNIPGQRDDATIERDFGAILSALLPKLLDAVPTIVSAVSGQPAPRSAQEEADRFLPFLSALIPAVVSAVPSIIGAFNQQRGESAPPPPMTDPEIAQRFFGPLLAAVVPSLLQSAPSILGSIFGPRRDLAATTW